MSKTARTQYGYRLEPSGLSWSYGPMPTTAELRERVAPSARRERGRFLSQCLGRVAKWSQAVIEGTTGKRLRSQEAT